MQKILQEWKARVGAKKKGMVDDVLPILMFVLIAGILLLFFINTNVAINKKTKLNQIGRKYMIIMESQGYLYPEDIDALESELADAGFCAEPVTDSEGNPVTGTFGAIDVTTGLGYTGHADGTNIYATQTDVGYGNQIELTLDVYCQTWLSTENGVDIFTPRLGKDMSNICVSLKSTSKN
jgi:hypothetical protein